MLTMMAVTATVKSKIDGLALKLSMQQVHVTMQLVETNILMLLNNEMMVTWMMEMDAVVHVRQKIATIVQLELLNLSALNNVKMEF